MQRKLIPFPLASAHEVHEAEGREALLSAMRKRLAGKEIGRRWSIVESLYQTTLEKCPG